MFGYEAHRLLSLEETKEVATKKKEAFQTFVICLLAVDEFRNALVETWRDRIALGKPITKLSDDYGNNKFTLAELRDRVNENMELATQTTDRVAMIQHIYNANIATSVYEDLYKRLMASKTRKLRTHKLINKKYQAYLKHRNLLFEANLRLVPRFVAPFARRGVDFEDLVQEGRLGLLRAVEKYDPTKEIRFSSYASWWIKQGIRKALKNDRRTVRLPHHVYDYVSRVSKASAGFRMENQRDPTLAELSALTGLSRDKIESLSGVMRDLVSLETPMKVSKEELKDYIANEVEEQNHVEDGVLGRQMQTLIGTSLTDQEAQIIRRHFGVSDDGTMRQEELLSEIAKDIGLGTERTRQIMQRALGKLRAALQDDVAQMR